MSEDQFQDADARKASDDFNSPALPQQEEPATRRFPKISSLQMAAVYGAGVQVYWSAKRIYDAFTSGHNPTETQLNRLAGAMQGFEFHWTPSEYDESKATSFSGAPIAPLLGQDDPMDLSKLSPLPEKEEWEDWSCYWSRCFETRTRDLRKALTSLAAAQKQLDHRFDQVAGLAPRAQMAEHRLELAEASLAEARAEIERLKR